MVTILKYQYTFQLKRDDLLLQEAFFKVLSRFAPGLTVRDAQGYWAPTDEWDCWTEVTVAFGDPNTIQDLLFALRDCPEWVAWLHTQEAIAINSSEEGLLIIDQSEYAHFVWVKEV